MLNLGELKIGIKTDAKKAQSELSGLAGTTTDVERKTSASQSRMSAGWGKVGAAAAAVAATAAAACVSAAVELSKQVLETYGEFEQLKGGVEVLFGEASDELLAYSKKAWKTAGMSANEYLEISQSFSAKLIRDLGGDTQAAVEIVDKTVSVMADNVAGMGTSMESVQNAFQGFAKENFTMLDNLKLGYSGTKEGMQELIDHANKLKEANGEMADLSIDSFADIVEAIGLVQDEMKLTGVASEEASKTLQGSINATKSAWENFTTALGDPEGDVGQAFDDLVEAANNAVVQIGETLATMGENIVDEFLTEEQKQMLIDRFDNIQDKLDNWLNPALEDCAADLKDMADKFEPLIQDMQPFIQYLDDTAIGSLTVLADAIGVIATVLGSCADQLDQLYQDWQTYQTLIEVGFTAFKTWFETEHSDLYNKITTTWNGLCTYIEASVGFMIGIVTGDWSVFNHAMITDTTDMHNSIKQAFDSLPTPIKNALDKIMGDAVVWGDDIADEGTTAGQDFTENITTELEVAKTDSKSIGEYIAQGLADGISSGGWLVRGAASSIGHAALNAAMAALQEHSPSKAFYRVGEYAMQGLAIGIQETGKEAIKAAEKAAYDVTDAFNISTPDVSASYDAFVRSKHSNSEDFEKYHEDKAETYSVVVNNYSPKALSEKESAREYRRSMRQLALA